LRPCHHNPAPTSRSTRPPRMAAPASSRLRWARRFRSARFSRFDKVCVAMSFILLDRFPRYACRERSRSLLRNHNSPPRPRLAPFGGSARCVIPPSSPRWAKSAERGRREFRPCLVAKIRLAAAGSSLMAPQAFHCLRKPSTRWIQPALRSLRAQGSGPNRASLYPFRPARSSPPAGSNSQRPCGRSP